MFQDVRVFSHPEKSFSHVLCANVEGKLVECLEAWRIEFDKEFLEFCVPVTVSKGCSYGASRVDSGANCVAKNSALSLKVAIISVTEISSVRYFYECGSYFRTRDDLGVAISNINE